MTDLLLDDIVKRFEKEGIPANLKKASRFGRALYVEDGQISCNKWIGLPNLSPCTLYRTMHLNHETKRYTAKLWEYKEARVISEDRLSGLTSKAVAWWFVRIHKE